MGQVTLYLDSDTEERMKQAAHSAGVSQSRWVAQLIRQQFETQWPAAVRGIFGSWTDFPTLQEIREGMGEDRPREAF